MSTSLKKLLILPVLGTTVFLLGVARPTEPLLVPSPSASARAFVDGGATDAHYLDITTSQLQTVLNDPDNRIPEDFKVPAGVRPIVGFWLKIYAKYSLYHTLIYDRDNHDKIYEVIDNRELFRRGLTPMVLEITSKARINSVIKGYKSAIAQLERNPKMSFKAGTPGATLVSTWGRVSKKEWRRIAEAIRTQTGQRDRIMEGLASADRFFPAMEAIFKKMGIPEVITRLPLVESSFNLNAHSKAAAVGVWQFLEKSAQEYLVVDSHNKIDERLSPIKSTYAAARMFKRNHKLLGDWGLAIIAYNHGPKNLIPIRKKFGGQKITELLRMTERTPLGYASRSFYACFLAALHAEKYRDQLYGNTRTPHPDAISIVKMKKPASVFEIASLYNISIHELRVFNPDIFDLKRKLPAGTRIVLPRKHGESLVETPRVGPLDSRDKKERRGIASELEFIEYIR